MSTREGEFTGRRFDAVAGRCRLLAAVAAEFLPLRGSIRILDIGCGTGGQLFELLQVFPEAGAVGVDISDINVVAARESAGVVCPRADIRFLQMDYLQFGEGVFDLIVSDSTLHNIGQGARGLFAKVARDLKENGVLIVTIPYSCLYNHFLWMVRKILRLFRCSFLDGILYRLGAAIHGNFSAQMIKERINYMYLLPFFYDSPEFRRILREECGFSVVEERDYLHFGLGMPKHRVLVIKRTVGI